MSADSSFRCPVCRAAQPLQETCRRCQADLRLVMRARLRLNDVKQKYAAAADRGDRVSAQDALAELRWLSPADAAACDTGTRS